MVEVRRISMEEAAALAAAPPFVDAPVRLDSDPRAGSPHSRWSYVPGCASLILQATREEATLRSASGVMRRWADPLEALAWLSSERRQGAGGAPPFKTGWVGYLSYDLGRHFESLPSQADDDLGLPLFSFTYHDRVLAIDHHERIAYECRSALPGDPIHFKPAYATSKSLPASNFSRDAYERAVERAIAYIGDGDVFQVNLSQRFRAGLPTPPRALYDQLRRAHPAWYGACLDYGDHAVLSNSPELFLEITPARTIRTRPIKGTRPRSPEMMERLLHSEKDQAELNMIIDLERNDLGRICQTGTVNVSERRVIEPHPTVYHGAATIEGVLRDDVTFLDVLRATFPGGSVTGAPKIRAMEIIEELEPVRRGPYCGAIGFLSDDGHAQFNVAIRTMIAKRDRVYFSVGGGIVADSTPAEEYEETLVKATAMMSVLA